MIYKRNLTNMIVSGYYLDYELIDEVLRKADEISW
jgi:predicted nucleic acid-binding protein